MLKKATPLYHQHNQPRVPLNQNYYDLYNDETLAWQADLLKKYKIDDFCFYHYCFKIKIY
ncbi:glycoside hydrolase family 99-like domain-containing protein [Acinetobacter albensis]|uniref:glycoside hydrolase family 99-like domain-containing protein n=1 Tax=Acinetobacter albensis TaxID=1673609 RepID=UPI003877E86D